MKTSTASLYFALFSAVFTPPLSYAHPHSWISMQTEIVGDPNSNNIIGFNMTWHFDAMTSAYMLDGYDLSAAQRQQSMQSLANSVMSNMYNEHYFTYFYDQQTPIRYKQAVNGSLSQDKANLILSFYLPLSKPQPAHKNSLRLLIFEPSYYIDMSWKAKTDIFFSAELRQHCEIKVEPPTPTTEQINYAVTLPIDADPDNALGQLFTQTAHLNCLP